MNITKIVITGGPCGGKSTLLSAVRDEISALGYKVICVGETATELIEAGVRPEGDFKEVFQRIRTSLQKEKEEIYEKAAMSLGCENILLVFDRGMADSCAYMGEERFSRMLSDMGISYTAARDSYDGVFQLETCAKGASESYTLSNNKARTETAEEAAKLDDAVTAAWVGTPHFRFIGATARIEEKRERLLKEIKALLGIPKPLEIERKYLIEYPDLEKLSTCPFCKMVEISQTYLSCDEGEERVRKRGRGDDVLYFHTIKKKECGAKRIEIEKSITREEYEKLLERKDRDKITVDKKRYCLLYKGQYFELDVYPFWNDRAIVELEMTDEDTEPLFPRWIKVIKEVTEDKAYKNSSLAKNRPV